MSEPIITKFWIEETEFSDVDNGWAKYSDGTEQFEIDVMKDPEVINEVQRLFLNAKLSELTIGLTSEQLRFLYIGLFDEIIGTNWVELETGA
jgi:hypothetical protein